MSLSKLKEAIKNKNIVYGTQVTLKNLKLGKTKTVFLARDCPNETKDKIKKYSAEVIELDEPSNEIALICKRAHSVLVLSC